ncbi:MAG: hypothetical protein KDK36_17080, partial [Leptospiraceae bacterium]|nr:hypothetical protein [Leptospiraceae bacterium]
MVLFHRIKKIFLLLFLVISLFNSCNYFFKQESIFLDGEWEYYWDQRKSKDSPPISLKDDKWKVYKIGTEPDNRTENENNILWIRKKIPEINLNSPNLLIRNPIPCLEIFIEDKSILEIGSINSEKKLEYNKDFFPIIPLKENFSDKYIYLKMYSQSNFLLGLYETPSVGPYKVLLSEFIQKNQSYSSMGFLFVFIGLCCIYFYIIRKQNILISFAVMSLSTGVIYGILSGFFGALWFEDAPLVLKTYCISTLVTPIGFIGLFYNIFGNGKKHINFILLVAYTVYIIIFIPLLFLE